MQFAFFMFRCDRRLNICLFIGLSGIWLYAFFPDAKKDQNRKVFGKCDAENMLKAVDAVKRNILSVKETSSAIILRELFPHDQIRRRIDNKTAIGQKLELPSDLESSIAGQVKEAAEKQFVISAQEIVWFELPRL